MLTSSRGLSVRGLSGLSSEIPSTPAAFNPFTETPVEGVHWRKGPEFGKPDGVRAYQIPRTYSFGAGFRF